MKATEIKQLLPHAFQQAAPPNSPLAALLAAMEALHDPCDQHLDRLPLYFDPRRAPARFLPFLASWLDIDASLALRIPHLRELTANAAALAKMRGTRQALIDFLETATGIRGFEVDEPLLDPAGVHREFHIRVSAPPQAKPLRAVIEAIVEREKPAYVTSELVFESDADPHE